VQPAQVNDDKVECVFFQTLVIVVLRLKQWNLPTVDGCRELCSEFWPRLGDLSDLTVTQSADGWDAGNDCSDDDVWVADWWLLRASFASIKLIRSCICRSSASTANKHIMSLGQQFHNTSSRTSHHVLSQSEILSTSLQQKPNAILDMREWRWQNHWSKINTN